MNHRRRKKLSRRLFEATLAGDAPPRVTALLRRGADPERPYDGGATQLCAAARRGHTGTVRVLLTHGAGPNLREDHGTGWSPLDRTHHGPHPETAELLVAAGAQPTRC